MAARGAESPAATAEARPIVALGSDGSEVFFGSSLTTEGVLYRKIVDSSEPPEPLLRVPSYWGASPWSLGPAGEIACTTWHRDTETDIHFYSPDEGKELSTNLDTAVSERQPIFSGLATSVAKYPNIPPGSEFKGYE